MENRINRIVTLEDGSRYFVVNQANYQNRMFLFVNKLNEDNDLSKTFSVLEEVKKEDKLKLEEVTDIKILEVITKAFQDQLA